ncbi:hypothetical protein Tco_0003096 [Tanacetum coccineum]
MFNRENVDYPALIWEDTAYQIDHMKEKRSIHENMPYPQFTKIIINHFLKQHKSLTNLNHKHYHTMKDDGIVSRLKFVRICKDYQEYGLSILDVMLTDAIKRSESYKMFIKYSTNQIPPKKSRGKGSKGKKEESRRKLSADDNIISDDPNVALELLSLSAKLKLKKQKQQGKSSKSVVLQDTPGTPKSKPATSKIKLKGAPSLTPVEQEAADTMKALKESKKTSKRQPDTGGSNEGTGSKPGVPNESTIVSTTSSEGTGAKPRVLEWGDEQDSEYSDDDNDDVEKDDKDGDDDDDEGDDHISDIQDADDEDAETESDEMG